MKREKEVYNSYLFKHFREYFSLNSVYVFLTQFLECLALFMDDACFYSQMIFSFGSHKT